MLVVIDLDGVVWLSEDPVPGSARAVARLRAAGHRVLFVTNNSQPTVTETVAKLEGFGVAAGRDDLCTSAQAAASLTAPGDRVLVCAGPGVVEAVEERGARPVEVPPAEVVIVGFHRHFDYDRLALAFAAVDGGARLVGTNDDPTYPTPEGPVPGGGSLLAAVAYAAGVEPVVAGKPHAPMAGLVRARMGLGPEAPLGEGLVVGDRPSTDGAMALRLGLPFHLVLTGVTEGAAGADPPPVAVWPDLAALAAGLGDGGSDTGQDTA